MLNGKWNKPLEYNVGSSQWTAGPQYYFIFIKDIVDWGSLMCSYYTKLTSIFTAIGFLLFTFFF